MKRGKYINMEMDRKRLYNGMGMACYVFSSGVSSFTNLETGQPLRILGSPAMDRWASKARLSCVFLGRKYSLLLFH